MNNWKMSKDVRQNGIRKSLWPVARSVLSDNTIMARETLALSRCIPLADGRSGHFAQSSHVTVSPVNHSQEISISLHPSP
ncbi:MAG: hypothetical protein GY761_10275 [Hyphomicrobiales bacterium]|nr:hypothetical protein [Hyphomicrobiales bacterium]